MNKPYIPQMPGNIRTKGNTYTNILTLLGLSLSPMNQGPVNDGRSTPPVAAFVIDGMEFALSDVLTALNDKLSALPTIEESDEGKVLMVSDGKYVLASLPTGEE